MNKLQVIVVDDEKLSRDYLISILEQFPDLNVVAQCSNGRDALKAQALHQADVIFLDIEMPGLNGFDVVKAMQADTLPMIVFATAYEAYAVDAFDLQAVDYVLKPFQFSRVERAVERVRSRHLISDSGDKSAIMAVVDQLSSDNKKAESPSMIKETQKLAIKEGGEIVLVPFSDIAWIDAAGDYMCVHVDGKTYVLRCTMKQLEQKLESTPLVRIHRSTLVNLDKVISITGMPKGECQLHLGADIALKVSRNYRKHIEHLLV